MKTCLAVDIGGTKIAAALVKDNVIVTRVQISTPTSKEASALTVALTDLLTPLALEADHVAVASTGIINHGVLTALNPDNLGGLNHFPLHQVISEITQLPIVVINDAQAAAWFEYKALDQAVSDMAFITVSTGVGAGFVQKEILNTGARGIAGHAGHMLADPNGPVCGCGRKGCVESIASGTAIGVAGQPFFGTDCDGEAVYQHLLAGDKNAIAIVERSASTIANLIADLTISLDLDVVVLGGSVGLASGYLARVKTYLERLPNIYVPDVIAASSGADAGLLGVALWAEQSVK